METALLRYAQERSATWAAERFASEFMKRDLEERWVEAAATNSTPYSPTIEPSSRGTLAGPVDASVQDAVVVTDGQALDLVRRAHARHPSVPRPPAAEPEPAVRRRRWRDRTQPEVAPAWTITPAEAARMSAAGRRLYGFDDPTPER